jgi:hypothetical protein
VLVSSPYDNLRLKLSIFIQFISISTLEILYLSESIKECEGVTLVEIPIAPESSHVPLIVAASVHSATILAQFPIVTRLQ